MPRLQKLSTLIHQQQQDGIYLNSMLSITNREASKESRKAEFLQRKQIANLIPSAPKTEGQKAA